MTRDEQLRILGRNIAYYRKLRNLSQLELSELCNLSRTHISNVEACNMKTSISLDALLNIADALDVPVTSLLEFDK